MKTIVIACLLVIVNTTAVASSKTDSLIIELNKAIEQAKQYDEGKLKTIAALNTQLKNTAVVDLAGKYAINLKLYDEYKYYNYDSALKYSTVLQDYAKQKNDPKLIAESKLRYAFILLSAGLFTETFDALNSIVSKDLEDASKGELYSLMARSYYNLADYTSDAIHSPGYNSKATLYLDSALLMYPKPSFEYAYYKALKFLKKEESDSAINTLLELTKRTNLSYHETALATSTMGGIFMNKGREKEGKPYLIEASIADIKSSTKETLALLVIAGIVYKEGQLEDALLYIEKANADAEFYNARLRKVQIGAVLPLIEGDLIKTIKQQKQKLQLYLIALSIVVLALAGLAFVIFMQVKKLKLARQRLYESNIKQQQINQQLIEANELKEKYNNQLKEINNRLSESNKIKEEYIGYYFNMDTEFLGRIEKLMTTLDKRLADRKWDEMKFLLKSVDLKKEKEELVKNFDKIFVRLFPNFVAQFNSMFNEEDKIILKDDQLLNTELRIFALIRLGITENEKIAEILDYSINTIYAKKTKIRSKTIVSKDEFERTLIENTSINL